MFRRLVLMTALAVGVCLIVVPAYVQASEKDKKSKESPGIANAEEAIRQLNGDHEAICRTFRDAAQIADEFNDQATADMLTDRLKAHEHMAWMLRSLMAA